MYKLIACDMDETLLNDNHQLSQKNIDAIMKAKNEYGIKFVPATGKGFSMVQEELKQLGLYNQKEEYVISYNGGVLSHNLNNEVLSCHTLNKKQIIELLEFGLLKDVCIHIYTIENLYIVNINEDEKTRITKMNIPFIQCSIEDIETLVELEVIKIIYQNTDTDYLQSLEPTMEKITKDQLSVSYSSSRYMEFNPLGIDKGRGLQALCDLLQIDIKDTISVGDNFNDVSMLQVSGLSVCPQNGVEEIKQMCDYVTQATNNEGVVAELLNKYVFHENI